MATADTVRDKLAVLIDKANGTTGRQDATLTGAVDALIAGYGQGGGGGITPSGTITLTKNGSFDVTNYATANVAIPTQDGKTVMPGTAEQTAVAANRYTTGAVKVAGDTNLVSKNIKAGVSIFGVEGIYKSDGTVEAEDLTALHIWEKYVSGADRVSEEAVADVILSYSSRLGTGNPLDNVDYSDAIRVVDGALELAAPVTKITLTVDTRPQIVGKYIYAYNNSAFYRIPSDAVVSYHTSTYTDYVQVDKAFKLTAETGGSFLGVVVADNSAAYPEDGEQDGYQYVYIGTLAGSGSSDGSLPALTNPGTATDLASGKQLINGSGAIVTGSLFELTAGNTLYGNNEPTLNWRDDGKVETVGTYGVAGTGDGGIVRPGAKFAVRVPAEQYGDATAADVAAGKTFTSASGLKMTGTHKCAVVSGELAMKTGTTTFNVIDTGLSHIHAITLYKTAFSSTGLIQVTADFLSGILTCTYCSTHSTFTQTVVVADGAAQAAVDGGTFTWNGSSYAAMTTETEYHWFAVGTA